MAPAACEADMRPRCSRKPAIKRLSNSTEVNDCKGRQKVLSAGRDRGRIIRELLERSGGRDVVNTSITDPTASRKFTWLRNAPKPPAGAQLQNTRSRSEPERQRRAEECPSLALRRGRVGTATGESGRG